jgi:DNA-binding NarL/FixJ family response regulator
MGLAGTIGEVGDLRADRRARTDLRLSRRQARYAVMTASWRAQVEVYRKAVALFQSSVRPLIQARRDVVADGVGSPIHRSRTADGIDATTPRAATVQPRPFLNGSVAVNVREDGRCSEGFMPLTPRQAEVAALIARGHTNREIAEALVLTPGTVANHVENILNRLGYRSRSRIAAWAVERGLAVPHDEPIVASARP